MTGGARRGLLLIWALLVVLGWLAFQHWAREPLLTQLNQARPTAPTVLFVVMDTVRADHLSLCGYGRPTSPVLQALVADGAAHSCEAVAPGSWTLPSHASYFSGLPVPEHGAHFVSGDAQGAITVRSVDIRPLAPDFQTLAEDFRERGYQAVGLSANPVLQPATGLHQGFTDWRVAASFGPWYGDGLIAQLDSALRQADDRDQPLFLFVNISDAHDPWFGVPEGVDWLPARPDRLFYFETDPQTGRILPDGPWQRYVTGALSEAEAAAFRLRLIDDYDWALSRADATLGRVLDRLRAHGWQRAGLRLVVVSDHGEFLGEHGLLHHGHYLWEENQRVPLLIWESEGPSVVRFPDRVSALEAHDLVLRGARPQPARPIEAVAYPDATWQQQSGGKVGQHRSAALWTADSKLLWMDGARGAWPVDQPDNVALDLISADTRPQDLAALEALVQRALASGQGSVETDPALIEALRAAGYLE